MHLTMDVIREARWFGRERAVRFAKAMAIAFAPFLVWYYFQATGRVGSDFMGLWAAGKLALAGHPADAYVSSAQSAFQTLHLSRHNWVPFFCTPPFLLVITPFALLPYPIALPVFVVATYAVWLLLSRRLLAGSFWPVAVYPGAVVSAWHAQNGFVTGALFVGAVLALRSKRPILAGALFGALIIKPHLAILVPVALIASREWRAFFAAAASATGLLLLSWVLMGSETFAAFLASRSLLGQLISGTYHDFLLRMPTVFAAVTVAAGPQAGWIAQAASALVMIAVVWRTWSRPGDLLGKAGVLAIATVLATPYLFVYDLPLLIVPVCWLAAEGISGGFRPWGRLALAAFYWWPLIARTVALPLHFNPTAPGLLLFLAFVVRRPVATTATAAPSLAKA
jgi:hypothetical protein